MKPDRGQIWFDGLEISTFSKPQRGKLNTGHKKGKRKRKKTHKKSKKKHTKKHIRRSNTAFSGTVKTNDKIHRY
jgi:hypothetical protein